MNDPHRSDDTAIRSHGRIVGLVCLVCLIVAACLWACRSYIETQRHDIAQQARADLTLDLVNRLRPHFTGKLDPTDRLVEVVNLDKGMRLLVVDRQSTKVLLVE